MDEIVSQSAFLAMTKESGQLQAEASRLKRFGRYQAASELWKLEITPLNRRIRGIKAVVRPAGSRY